MHDCAGQQGVEECAHRQQIILCSFPLPVDRAALDRRARRSVGAWLREFSFIFSLTEFLLLEKQSRYRAVCITPIRMYPSGHSEKESNTRDK